MAWRQFGKTMLGVALSVASVLYAAVLIIDPYDSIWFSPPFDRAPITLNQRFSFPALARKARFDSAVIGTSTIRLLRPAKLNQVFGGNFVNLSMNDARAYEEWRILELFARHHPDARTVVFGIDIVWCEVGETYKKFTRRPFPPWLYDENLGNDLLYMFNFPTVEEAGRELAFLTGFRAMKYGRDGYSNFLPPDSEYDLARVQRGIYGDSGPRRHNSMAQPFVPTRAERKAWTFATHPFMRAMLTALPESTLKIFLFVPYHHFNQSPPGSLSDAYWRECKRRVTNIAAEFPNAHVLDFMIPSEITLRDANYWDVLHYNVAVADRLAELIAQGVQERSGVPGLFDYLSAGDGSFGDVGGANQ